MKYIIIVTGDDKVYEFEKYLLTNSVFLMSDNEAVVESLIKKSIVEELSGKQVIDIKNSDCHRLLMEKFIVGVEIFMQY